MKKLAYLTGSAALMISLTACSGSNTADFSNKTVTGKITAIDGSKVTLQLGELTKMEMNGQPGQASDAGGQSSQQSGQNKDQQSDQTDSSGQNQANGQTPPDMPEGQQGQTPPDMNSGQQPPQKPDGQQQDAQGSESSNENQQSNNQTPPDMPNGQQPTGNQPGQMNGGAMQQFTAGEDTAVFTLDQASIAVEQGAQTKDGALSDLKVDDIVTVQVGDNNAVKTVTVINAGGSQGGFGTGQVSQGTAATTIDQDGTYNDKTYSSSKDDENALRIDKAKVTLNDINVEKSAGSCSNTESGNFYGMNAGLLVTNGAEAAITGAKVTTSVSNGNGVFSYGTGTKVNISDSEITTDKDNSGGLMTAGGGSTTASNVSVTTSGTSSAALRSDRGGGTVSASGGSYTSKGYDSPAVYSTADITVKDAKLTAENSEALVIEGKNSITLENCTVSGNMSKDKGTASANNVQNVMIYQSMSGDAAQGTSKFSMTGGTLTGSSGDMFYFTNTAAEMNLSGVKLVNNDKDGCLMRIAGNSSGKGWGQEGANGAQVTVKASKQKMEGSIVVDTISTLKLTLAEGTEFTGTVNIEDNKANGEAVSDNAVVTVEKGAVWKLTGDCTITSLDNQGTIDFNGHTITLADGTVLK